MDILKMKLTHFNIVRSNDSILKASIGFVFLSVLLQINDGLLTALCQYKKNNSQNRCAWSCKPDYFISKYPHIFLK